MVPNPSKSPGAICPSWRKKIYLPLKPHLGWFAQVKLGTKKITKNKTKNNIKLSGRANLPYAEKSVFLNSGNNFLQISGSKKSNVLQKIVLEDKTKAMFDL